MSLDLVTLKKSLPGFTVTHQPGRTHHPGKIIVHARSGRSELRIEIPESAFKLLLEEFGNRWLKPAFVAMGGLEVAMKSVAQDRKAAGLGPVGQPRGEA